MRRTATKSSDVALAKQLREQNPQAWEGLCGYRVRLILTLHRKFKGLIEPEDVEDIVHDGLLRAFLTGDRYNPDIATVWTWLNTLAHYEALSFLRERRHLSPRKLDEMADSIAATVEQQCVVNLDRPSLEMEELLQKLPAVRAEMIRLRHYAGWTYEDIAEKFQLQPSTVEAYISRTRGQLKQWILELREGDTKN